MLLRAVILAAALAALLAPSASAATVTLEEVDFCTDLWGSCRYMIYSRGGVLTYAGENEEPNRVTVTRTGTGVLVADAGAQLRAGGRCMASRPGSARCELGGLPLVGYRLGGGDGADRIAVLGALAPAAGIGQPRVLLGGPGDDVLVGGADADALVGEAGADRLAGGGGDDRFFFASLGAGRTADGAESDIADGGPGIDTADYTLRTRSLRLALGGRAAGGGARDEHDRLTAVEQILGGKGDDVLIGSDAADRLDGRVGDDRLAGRGGDDVLIGGIGADVLRGGDGNDRLGTGPEVAAPSAPGRDRAVCGRGRDVIGELETDDELGDSWRGAKPDDLIARDCELVGFGLSGDVVVAGFDPRPRRRGAHAWEFRNPCAGARAAACAGRIELALSGRRAVVASAALGRGSTVEVPLGPIAARRLGRATRVTVRVRVRVRVAKTARDVRRSETSFVIAVR